MRISDWSSDVCSSDLYFIQGTVNPVPVPLMAEFVEEDDPEPVPEGVEGRKVRFKNAVNLGVSAEELAAIFDPFFYKVISNQGATNAEKIALGLLVVILLGVVWLGYQLVGGSA